MKPSLFQKPDWCLALTLTERISTLNRASFLSNSDGTGSDFGQRRLDRWRKQSPFSKHSFFQQRLEADGLDKETFLHILGEPVEAVKDRVSAPPQWLEILDEAFTSYQDKDDEIEQYLLNLPWDEQSKKMLGFLNLASPLLQWGWKQLREGIQALSFHQPEVFANGQKAEKYLLADLAGKLLPRLSRTLILELNVARLRGNLKGKTPHDRFKDFVQKLYKQEYALSILKEYPVLARQLAICTKNWVDSSLEFISHLYLDWEAIVSTFSPEENPGDLVGLRMGAGDSHQDGRSVIIAEFESGLLIAYKPKSMSVGAHFQELLSWLNDKINCKFFQTIKILDQGIYGWIEYVKSEDCQSIEEIQRFYKRQGAYLSLLHFLEASDFHFENLIATGEFPILIDLETLWHQKPDEPHLSGTPLSEDIAARTVANSVLRVGLLPMKLWAREDFGGVDISGLGANQEQLVTPVRVLQFENAKTDSMHVTRKRVTFPGRKNRPTLNGENVNALDYLQNIVDGFSMLYRILIENQDGLLSDTGPLVRFAQDEVRSVLRPTQTYGLLLSESFHPDLLRDALDRDRHFDRLWVPVEEQPYFNKIIPAEREDLWKGDIPIFFTRPSSRDLWSSSGKRFTGFYRETSLEYARQQLQEMGEKDLEQQIWFILASFTSVAIESNNIKSRKEEKLDQTTIQEREVNSADERFIKVAKDIGKRLEELALMGKGDACWIGLSITGNSLRPMPLGADLYSGLMGICLFLAYLGIMTSNHQYTLLAEAALQTASQQMKNKLSSFPKIGAFSGWGGLIYALAHLGVIWRKDELRKEIDSILNILPDLITRDEEFDIMSGAAGCLVSLMTLQRDLEIARQANETALVAVLVFIFAVCIALFLGYETAGSLPVGWMWFLAYATSCFGLLAQAIATLVLHREMSGNG